MKKMIRIAAVCAGVAGVAQGVTIVSDNLAASYDTQLAEGAVWANRTGSPLALDMEVQGNVTLNRAPMTLLNIESWWTFNSSSNINTIVPIPPM